MARRYETTLADLIGELTEMVFEASKLSWKIGAGLAAVFAVLTIWTFFAALGSVMSPRAEGFTGAIQEGNFVFFAFPALFAVIAVALGIGAIKRYREEQDFWPKF